MINKIADSVAEALAGVQDGATVLIGGFGTSGNPIELINGLIAQGARDLTVVNNNAGNGDAGLAALLKSGQVRKIICSFPRQVDSYVFDELYRSGKIELELVPQGNLAERMRAAAPASAPSSAPRPMARSWPKAKKPARSTASTTCWSTPSTAMWPWSRPRRATAGAT